MFYLKKVSASFLTPVLFHMLVIESHEEEHNGDSKGEEASEGVEGCGNRPEQCGWRKEGKEKEGF